VSGTPGLVYAWTYGDLRGLLAAWRDERISRREAARWARDLLATLGRASVHMTWRWDDPMPTLMLYARHLPLLGRLVRRRTRRPLRMPSRAALSAAD